MQQTTEEKATFDPVEVTKKAVEKAGLSPIYNENDIYHNPAKNAKFGMDYNWHNNLVPDNVVDMIAAHETVESGIARAAHETLENTVNHRYFDDVTYTNNQKKHWFIGIIQELTRRDGFGAFGEIYARNNIDFDGMEVAPSKSDEKKGIDIRTTQTTYQVKTGESFNSSWDKKQADHLVWVETDENKIVDLHIDP